MTCCNIIAPSVNNPFLHNDIISELQNALASAGFLSEIYPLAQPFEMDMNGSRGIVPAIYGQNVNLPNNYIQMFPDGEKRGISFFDLPNGNYNLNRGTENGDLVDIIVRIIVTANLKNINASATYDYTDELISRTYLALESSALNQDINSINVIVDKNLVFSKYTYAYNDMRSLAYPMTAFAIELGMTVDYNMTCNVPDTFIDNTRITEDGCVRVTEDNVERIIE